MPPERSEAIVVRGVDFTETSRIVTFLTPQRGRLACLAKGARRPHSPFAPVLDTFNRVEIVFYWKESRSVHPLAEATLLQGFQAIKASLPKSAYAALALEVASTATHENEPCPAIYHALDQGLEAFERWREDPRQHAAWQLWRILAAAGFEPTVDTCVRCGCPVTQPRRFALEGGVACSACGGEITLTEIQASALQNLARSTGACPAFPGLRDVFSLLQRYAARQWDLDFRSARVLDQLFS